MKKLLILFAATITAVSAFTFTACNNDWANGDSGSTDNGITDGDKSNSTDTENGAANESESVTEHVHVYSKEWTYNPEYHWHAPDCGHNVEISDKAEHTFIDNECVVCQYYKNPTLRFTLSVGGQSYTVTGANDKATDITVPAEYYGLPVTAIGENAFRNFKNLESVSLPDGIKIIEDCAFYGCSVLTEITLPESVTEVRRCAFMDCTSLNRIILPNSVNALEYSVFDNTAYFNNLNNWTGGVLYVGNHLVRAYVSGSFTPRNNTLTVAALAFNGCDGLTSVTLPDSVKYVGTLAFLNCYALENVTLSNNLEYFGAMVFNGCRMQEITLPSSINYIGSFALYQFSQINYIGTPEKWNEITKEEYCVSETCQINFK